MSDKFDKIRTIEQWQTLLFTAQCSMEIHDETVLSDHIGSIVSELEFQIAEILKDGAIVKRKSVL